MANLNGFDANQVEPSNDFEPIPGGKYLAVITDSEQKPNKAGTGSYLNLTFQIIDGQFQWIKHLTANVQQAIGWGGDCCRHGRNRR